MKKKDDDVERGAENLKRLNGDKRPVKIYAVLDHVSRSGMLRKISLFIVKENEPICILRESKVTGCGMDMGFHLAYQVYCQTYGFDSNYQKNLEFHWM